MKKLYKIVILLLILFLLGIFIIRIINTKMMYQKAISNIENNYEMVFNIKLPDSFRENNQMIMGNLKTEHTSNLVHSINQVYESNYDLIIKKDNEYIYIYVDDLVSKIKYNNLFKIDDLSSCKMLDKDKTTNKYNYLCGEYKLSIYTSKILNRYLKSKIVYNDISIEFSDNNIIYKNGPLNLNYTNIKEDNYILNAKSKEKAFQMFYSYNNYAKYSFVYDLAKFNVILDNDIILSFNCDTRRYSNLKMTLSNKNIDIKDNYHEVPLSDLLSKVLSSEIYALFN